jgi:hypothetical protein
MARPAVTPTLYQEVQLSTLPASPASILKINTTGNNSQTVTLFGAGRKRGYNEISELDEESYARKHLASRASTRAVFSGAYWTTDDYWRCNAWIWYTKEMTYKEKAP